jgi:hypothetical protein
MIQTFLRIVDGKHSIEKEDRFNQALSLLDDGLYVVTVDKVFDGRSSKQNRYYWGVVVKAFQQGYKQMTGEEIGRMMAHETLKMELNFTELVNPDTGEVAKISGTTVKMNTKQFMEYIEGCRKWISEWLHTETPDPEIR